MFGFGTSPKWRAYRTKPARLQQAEARVTTLGISRALEGPDIRRLGFLTRPGFRRRPAVAGWQLGAIDFDNLQLGRSDRLLA